MQGTRVRSLVQEDPTCRRATEPMHHNYWACALELMSHNYWARMLQLLKPVRLEPVLHNKRSHRNEKPAHHNEEQPSLATTRESPRAAMKTQHSQKKKSYTWDMPNTLLLLFFVQQKLTQHCKATISQLKENKNKNKIHYYLAIGQFRSFTGMGGSFMVQNKLYTHTTNFFLLIKLITKVWKLHTL